MHGHGGEQRRDHQQGEDAAEAQAQAEQGAAYVYSLRALEAYDQFKK